jgi:hypothetical protein
MTIKKTVLSVLIFIIILSTSACSSDDENSKNNNYPGGNYGTDYNPDTGTFTPGTDSNNPNTNPVNPGTDSNNPNTNPVNPGTDSNNPNTDPVNPDTNTGDSDTNTSTGDSDTIDTDSSLTNREIVFSPTSRTFENSLQIQMSSQTNGEIRYTLDGSIPSQNSTLYSGSPISVSGTTEFQAGLFVNGIEVESAEAVYILRSGDITSDVPIVIIDNFNQGEPPREHVRGVIMIFDVKNNGTASVSNEPDVATRLGFRLRGQSTASFPKKPYRLEFWDRNDEDEKWPVLGMPTQSDWILRAPYADKAFIRDPFHYGLAHDMDFPAPRYAFCEFYKNLRGGAISQQHYEGVYLFIETIKVAKDRLNIEKLSPEDTTLPMIEGGYLFKFEWMVSDLSPTLSCNLGPYCWQDFEFRRPQEPNSAQLDYIRNYLYDFATALNTSGMTGANGYSQYVDLDSMVDQMILNEIGKEGDSYVRSANFYKDRFDVLKAGPLWDYNLSLGIGFEASFFSQLENMSTTGWMYDINYQHRNNGNDWFYLLSQDPAFMEMVKQRWRQLRNGVLSTQSLNKRIDDLVAPLGNAAQRNFQKWNNLNEVQVEMFTTVATTTWQGQIDYLRNWLHERAAWIDSQW